MWTQSYLTTGLSSVKVGEKISRSLNLHRDQILSNNLDFVCHDIIKSIRSKILKFSDDGCFVLRLTTMNNL